MAITPGQWNFPVQRRADWYVTLQFSDSNDDPIDLTGWTIEAEAWDQGRTTKYADFGVAYLDRPAGEVKISLTDEQTALFPNEVFYDVLLTNPAGIKEYYLEGVMFVSQGYTS